MNWNFQTRKNVGKGLFLLAGALILSLCFVDAKWWQISVFVLTGILVFFLFRLGRCKNCAQQMHHAPGQDPEVCPHCGTKIDP